MPFLCNHANKTSETPPRTMYVDIVHTHLRSSSIMSMLRTEDGHSPFFCVQLWPREGTRERQQYHYESLNVNTTLVIAPI